MRIAIYGTDKSISVDKRFADQLPKSLWMVRTRGGKDQPTGRYNGRTMTVVRMIGLMAGMPECAYILPKNGDWFDARLRNVGATESIPSFLRKGSGPRAVSEKVTVRLNGKAVELSDTQKRQIVKVLTA